MSVSSTLTPEKAIPDNGGPEQANPQQPKRFSFKHGAWLWIVLATIPIVAVLAFAILQPVKVRPRMGLAPGYVFTDMKGSEVTSEDMRGKLVFYNFTYAGCGEGCPQTTKTMAEIQKLVGGLDTGGLPVEFVTISFDPDRDTPAAAGGTGSGGGRRYYQLAVCDGSSGAAEKCDRRRIQRLLRTGRRRRLYF